MRCPHPGCTEVHDNNRYSELCPRSIELKRAKDRRYYKPYPSGRGWWSRFLRKLEAAQAWEQRTDEAHGIANDGTFYDGLIAQTRDRRDTMPKGTRRKIEVICDSGLPRRRTSWLTGNVSEVRIPVIRRAG